MAIKISLRNEGSLGVCVNLRPTPKFESLNNFEKECLKKKKFLGVCREKQKADCEGL